MKLNENPYHVYNHGQFVLFRNHKDFVYFINKFAILSSELHLQILAVTAMSTHFHVVIECMNQDLIDEFLIQLKKTYGLYYHNKYGGSTSRQIKTAYKQLENLQVIKNTMVYVYRNPVHHYIANYPLEYEYSSVCTLFADCLMPSEIYQQYISNFRTLDKLSYIEKRLIYGKMKCHTDFQYNSKGMIVFSSFVNQKRARAIWGGFVRNFIKDMNQLPTDTSDVIIDDDVIDLRTNGLSDIDVCKIIDDYAAQLHLKSFHFFNEEQLSTIIKVLQKKSVPQAQIKRCLWLN